MGWVPVRLARQMGTVGPTQLWGAGGWGKAGRTDTPQLGKVHSCQRWAKRLLSFV